MTREEIIAYIGPTINAQLTLTWDTAQTLGQFIEILDGQTPMIDDFLEYVLDNATEDITNMVESRTELEHYTKLVKDTGEEVWGYAD